eukprot:3934084-Rhodomonas_salina.4
MPISDGFNPISALSLGSAHRALDFEKLLMLCSKYPGVAREAGAVAGLDLFGGIALGRGGRE